MKRLLLLLLPLTAFAAAPATDWSPNLVLTGAWLNNASNGEAVWDRVGALQFGGDVLGSSRYAVTESDAFDLSAHFAADWYPRYHLLDDALGGARVDWQHTFGRGALAPQITAEAGADAVATAEEQRRGKGGTLRLTLAKRFRGGWRAALVQRFERYDAHATVFDRRDHRTAVEVGRDLGDATRVTFTGSWQQGDVVTYAQYHRPDLLAIARATAALRTFRQRMTAYATDAQTLAGRVAIAHAVSESAAVTLAYEYAQTSRTNLRFANQTVLLSLVRQF